MSSAFLLVFFNHAHAQTYNVYLGDLPQHSAFPWDAQPGAKTLAATYAYAKHVAKVDFMAVTDHTNGLSGQNNPNPFDAGAIIPFNFLHPGLNNPNQSTIRANHAGRHQGPVRNSERWF